MSIFIIAKDKIMAKILISWVARTNDFIEKSDRVDPQGANMNVHHHYFDGYDYHLILSQYAKPTEDTFCERLTNALATIFPNHKVHSRGIKIHDVIDLNEILTKVTALLLEYSQHQIDIFISPGTPTMQVAWYLAHASLGLKTRLFQMRRAKHSKGGIPEQVWVDIEKSQTTASYIIQQHSLDEKKSTTGFRSSAIDAIYSKAEKIAQGYPVSVLITGETGTGKELLAKYIHEHSPRKDNEFVVVNCSALGNELLESRLFGYEKGAFTGAQQKTDGLFHKANGGTIFLDEIGDITPYMQQTLLRTLQEKEVMRVGAVKAESVDVRVIAATNRDVYGMSMDKVFREDLYYRLAVAELHLPSLSEYKKLDRESLFNFLWKKAITKFNIKAPTLPKEIQKKILEYSFPGNIREMENLIDRIFAECEQVVTDENLPKRITQPAHNASWLLKDIEYEHIKRALAFCNGNVTRASKLIGVSYNTMRKKLI